MLCAWGGIGCWGRSNEWDNEQGNEQDRVPGTPHPPPTSSPVVKTLHFHCRGTGLISGQGTKMPLSAAKIYIYIYLWGPCPSPLPGIYIYIPMGSLPLTTPRDLIPWFNSHCHTWSSETWVFQHQIQPRLYTWPSSLLALPCWEM